MHWDKNNIIDDNVIGYLKALLNVSKTILFVSNNIDLSDNEINKVKEYCNEIFTRDNEGLDFAAWSYVLRKKGKDYFKNFDELILANDSCFGPLHPFEDMFEKMSNKSCDFWGITEHAQIDSKFGILDRHIQSYFIVFRKNVISSSFFYDFFNADLRQDLKYDDVVVNYEVRLTSYLENAGFSAGLYLGYNELFSEIQREKVFNHNHYNSSIWNWQDLIENKCPLLKKKALLVNFEYFSKNYKKGYPGRYRRKVFASILNWQKYIAKTKSQLNTEVVKKYLDNNLHEDYLEIYQNIYLFSLKYRYVLTKNFLAMIANKIFKTFKIKESSN